VITDPPVDAGAVKRTDADPFPAVASAPLLVGVSVTGPITEGVTVNVWGTDEPPNVSTIAVDNPPPDGIIVTVPL
jgi:hypothetical protein